MFHADGLQILKVDHTRAETLEGCRCTKLFSGKEFWNMLTMLENSSQNCLGGGGFERFWGKETCSGTIGPAFGKAPGFLLGDRRNLLELF